MESERHADLFDYLRAWAEEDQCELHNQVLHTLDYVVAARLKGKRAVCDYCTL